MIRSFRDRDTEGVFARERSRRLPTGLQQAALRKLLMLDGAESLADLMVPPGNRLEKLSGERAGQYSIRVNDRWRICCEWFDQGADRVEITGYD